MKFNIIEAIIIILCLFVSITCFGFAVASCSASINSTPNTFEAPEIIYFKDPQTGICFALMHYSGDNRNGPGLAYVPAELVPENLLK